MTLFYVTCVHVVYFFSASLMLFCTEITEEEETKEDDIENSETATQPSPVKDEYGLFIIVHSLWKYRNHNCSATTTV